MKKQLKNLSLFCRAVASRFFEVDGTGRAAALTFTSLLALVPLMVVSFNVLLLFSSFKDLGAQVQAFIFSNFLPETGSTIQSYLIAFVQQAAQLSWVGLIFLAITAILLLFSIEQSFNKIWHVQRQRHGLVALCLYCVALAVVPVLIGFSLALTAQFFAIPWVKHTVQQLHIGNLFIYGIPLLFTSTGFAFLYYLVPNCKVPLPKAIYGGILAAVLFEVAKHGFSFYIEQFPTYKLVYGALAAIPIFLLWMYVSWLVLLVGAVFVCILSEKTLSVSSKIS